MRSPLAPPNITNPRLKGSIVPIFEQFQLIGDSNFVRFASSQLGKKPERFRLTNICCTLSGLGLSISGQTSKQLYYNLQNRIYIRYTHISV